MEDNTKTGKKILEELKSRFLQYRITEDMMAKIHFVTDRGANIIKALEEYTRTNCMAHILNNCLQFAFEKVWLQTSAPVVAKCLKMCKKLIEYLKQSGYGHMLSRMVQQDVKTRWNTKLAMLESIKLLYDEIKQILDAEKQAWRLEGISLKILDEIIAILKNFKVVSDVLETESKCTTHQIILQMTALKLVLKLTWTKTTHQEVRDICQRCVTRVETTFHPDPHAFIALYLNPKFRLLKCLTLEEQERTKSLVFEQLMSIKLESLNGVSHASPSSESEILDPVLSISAASANVEILPENIIKQWEDRQSDFQKISQDNDTSTFEKEMQRYETTNLEVTTDDILTWWRLHASQFPLLNKLAKKILAIPASSAASERTFSVVERIMEERRLQLIDDNVDAILFLHSNASS